MRIHKDHLRKDYEEHTINGVTYFIYRKDMKSVQNDSDEVRGFVLLDDTMMGTDYVMRRTDILAVRDIRLSAKNLTDLLSA